MAAQHPIAEPCPKCKSPREWRGSLSKRRVPDEAEPAETQHLYLCTNRLCEIVSVLVVAKDGARKWRPNRNRWRDVIA